jgi:vacuolar-type H+-ATPase subunit D/Vma8
MDPKTKIAELERTLQQLIESVKLLNQRVNFLERENTRRKSDVTQISSAIKK